MRSLKKNPNLFSSNLEQEALQIFRDRIDKVDEQLVRLFDERAKLVHDVGEWKAKHNREIYDVKREQQVLEKCIKTKRSNLRDAEVQTLFSSVMENFRNIERARNLISIAKKSEKIPRTGIFAFFGFGLMSASVALALLEECPNWVFLIYDPYLSVDDFQLWNEAKAKSSFRMINSSQLQEADFLFLGAPIDVNREFARHFTYNSTKNHASNSTKKNRVILNLGSFQDELDEIFGFHPLAGKEVSGYQSAQADLFYGKTICITHSGERSSTTLKSIEALANLLGAESCVTNHKNHNSSLAYSSHLIQILSMAFGMILGKVGSQSIGKLIPRTAQEFLRLNGSNQKMWQPIFKGNKRMIIKTIEEFEKALQKIKFIISSNQEKPKSESKELNDLFNNSRKVYESFYLKRRTK